MPRQNATFGSLQMTTAFLGGGWAYLLWSERQQWTSILGIDAHQVDSRWLTVWIFGNALFAVLAFITALLVIARHPDSKAFAWVDLAIVTGLNGYFVVQAILAKVNWWIVGGVAVVLVACQAAVLGYRRPSRAPARTA